jgi:hypothetical protein
MADATNEVGVVGTLASGATANVRLTDGAGPKLVLPAWLAVIVTLPPPVRVTVLPESVAGPELTTNATGNPEVAAAVSAKGASPCV